MGIEIKGLTVPALLIKLDPNLSVEENIEQLEKKLSSAVFKGSYAVLDYNGMELTQEQSKKIEDILKKHNTQILGYQNTKSNDLKKSVNEKKSLKIVNKTLRSGQTIEYDGDVLILGDVNPDAYVTAAGSIIVMGALRGVVHAGANGDESAIIMALKLIPQQLRIASYIARSPDSYEEVNQPEKAYVENNMIVIEKIK
ncbi:MAG: septum site-determining protein MinC [Sulfurihydrogenibium sp.]|uniref:septum site-determining protein MinC n=1 Tax=Sulfurihydrogenibium sp. TaxID=2053621 RepID=UPI000CC99BB8|nr:MAG: septum site-determining protein MinC [Sulfurihydrogenibium sp.]